MGVLREILLDWPNEGEAASENEGPSFVCFLPGSAFICILLTCIYWPPTCSVSGLCWATSTDPHSSQPIGRDGH